MILIRLILFPVSFIYGIITFIRNVLYDIHIFKVNKFNVPVISVGNLSLGGTGKTPHVELLVRFLKEKHVTAVLSRGYKRKTRGFLIASDNSKTEEIGDEPLQIKKKFKNVIVAVDRNRTNGINRLLEFNKNIEAVILDDAFQHRAVKPSLSILLTEYGAFYKDDFVFPSGRLREWRFNSNRADIIIVTKTPKVFSPIERRSIVEKIKPERHQKLFFSYLDYAEITPFSGSKFTLGKDVSAAVLFTGIVNPIPLHEHLKRKFMEIQILTFPDHYNYTLKDIQKIEKIFNDIFRKNKIIITTEKDYMKLQKPEFSELTSRTPFFYVPVNAQIHKEDKKAFEDMILNALA
ncbi:MAG: tetraacyldisaccharide 4'-kinase [Bacteroidales bacterium]|nr:tetraacyldisaccharide 4'-kinase [Bacteroidales bacterium]